MKKAFIFSAILFMAADGFTQAFKEGSEVKAKWGGYWHRGTVIKVKGDKYLVHYIGYGPGYDQWLAANELEKFEYKGRVKSTASVAADTSKKLVASSPAPPSAIEKSEQTTSKSRLAFWKKNKEGLAKKEPAVSHSSTVNINTVENKSTIRSAPAPQKKSTVVPAKETSADTETQLSKTVAYQSPPAWTSNTPAKKMITPERVGEKLYLCHTIRNNRLELMTVYLGKGNAIVRNPRFGWEDTEKERMHNASNTGTYRIDNETMMIHWADGRSDNWRVAYSTMAVYGLDGRAANVQKAMPAGFVLNGRYELNGMGNLSQPLNVEFNFNGGFITRSSSIAQHTSTVETNATQRGKYTISGNRLELLFESGERIIASICVPVIGGKKYLVINNNYFPLL